MDIEIQYRKELKTDLRIKTSHELAKQIQEESLENQGS